MSIEGLLKSLKLISLRYGEDNIDRLHYFLTTNLLVAASTITAWKMFEGRVLECMSPTSFPNSWATMMIESLISMVRYLSPKEDDDATDRLHYLYSSNILLAFAVLISFKQFGGRPLECMFPNKFPGSWEQYAENYCWSRDTYYVQPDVHVAALKEEERYTPERQLSYYKWVPFFLLLQAACFRIPSVFWNYLSFSSGIRIHEIVEKAMDPSNLDESTRSRNIETLTRHMQNALKFHRRILKRKIEVHKRLKFLNVRYTAFFISLMYLVTKTLYLVNAILQLCILNKFLRTDASSWYGFDVIRDIVNGTEWTTSGYFPRVSVCDFTVRQVGNIQRYSVQCVLVINMFNEKIFVFLWFWYLFLVFCTVLSLLYWFIVLTCPCFGRWFISQSLELSEMKFDPDSKYLLFKNHSPIYVLFSLLKFNNI
uniref:Innexin n=1 Tax=Elaeophora elaphi TaxID=1147741 RepID=A0A0R3S431_9BILA